MAPLHFGAPEISTIFETGEGEQGTEQGMATTRGSSASVIQLFFHCLWEPEGVASNSWALG